jgi:hypothetical protein
MSSILAHKAVVVLLIVVIVAAAAAAVALSQNSSPSRITPNSPTPLVSTTPTALPVSTPTASPFSTTSPTPAPTKTNESATYSFEVRPEVKLVQTRSTMSGGDFNNTMVRAYAQFSWDATTHPYVRYYAITLHFNGNHLPTQSIFYREYWRAWNQSYSSPPVPFTQFFQENTFYYLANDSNVPNERNYITSPTNDIYLGQGQHGWLAFSVTDVFYDDPTYPASHASELGGLNAGQIQGYGNEMLNFVNKYVADWTLTVTPVS